MPANTGDIHERGLSRATIDAILECAALAIILFDRENKVIEWNKEAERIYGWTEQEVLGHRHPAVPAESLHALDDFRAHVLAGETLRSLTARRVRKDGAENIYGVRSRLSWIRTATSRDISVLSRT